MGFYHDLQAATKEEAAAFLRVPQIVDGLHGRITKDTYVAYLTEAFHHVKHTVPLMQAAHARLDPARQHFVHALDEYIEEESGHEFWILDDIAACGRDPNAARDSEPRFATEMMVSYVYDFIARRNPMGLFGMVFVLEGTSVLLATAGASAVQTALQLPPAAFRYLTSHGSLDQDHLRFFEDLMGEVTDPADQAAIIHVAKRVFVLFADIFRSIPHAQATSHAA